MKARLAAGFRCCPAPWQGSVAIAAARRRRGSMGAGTLSPRIRQDGSERERVTWCHLVSAVIRPAGSSTLTSKFRSRTGNPIT